MPYTAHERERLRLRYSVHTDTGTVFISYDGAPHKRCYTLSVERDGHIHGTPKNRCAIAEAIRKYGQWDRDSERTETQQIRGFAQRARRNPMYNRLPDRTSPAPVFQTEYERRRDEKPRVARLQDDVKELQDVHKLVLRECPTLQTLFQKLRQEITRELYAEGV